VQQLRNSQLDATVLAQIEGSLNSLNHAILFSTLFTLCMVSFLVWYFRHLIVRPVTHMTQVLEEIASGSGDLSKDLPLLTHDEILGQPSICNRFQDKKREISTTIQDVMLQITVESAHSLKYIRNSSDSATHLARFAN